MIKLLKKEDCCGCSACVQSCPKQCITMVEDEEGFLYPKTDESLCIDCGLCEKVCPVINQNENRSPLHVYAAKNPDDEVRLKSSSGGIFTVLARYVLQHDGVVFGARWDKTSWSVVHGYTESMEGLEDFRSSKYLQSRIGSSYKDTESFLKDNRLVLFTGTPCQIAGLKHFLRREYDNLLTCEIFCHSVPSPGIWQTYLDEKLSEIGWDKNQIRSVSFRDKNSSWKNYHFRIENLQGGVFDEAAGKNTFMRGFLSGLYTRPSCHQCPAKHLKSGSDITIGDFWGIDLEMPDYDDDKGTSALLVNTEKARTILNQIDVDVRESSFPTVSRHNPALVKSFSCSNKRTEFFLNDDPHFSKLVNRLLRTTLKERLSAYTGILVSKVFGNKFHSFIKHLIK